MNKFRDYYTDFIPTAPITVDEEVALIGAAQAGDEDAQMTLLGQYRPLLLKIIGSAAKVMNREDAEMVATLTFFEVLADHDVQDGAYRTGSLAARLRPRLQDALGVARTTSSRMVPVPKTTHRRYLDVMEETGGDLVEAGRLAPSYGLASSTLALIHAMTHEAPHVTGATEDADAPNFHGQARPLRGEVPDPFEAVNDAVLVDVAMGALVRIEREVVEHYFGFLDRDQEGTLTDAEVAHRLNVAELGAERVENGETVVSRATVQRRRETALAVMRRALGVPLTDKDERLLVKRDRLVTT